MTRNVRQSVRSLISDFRPLTFYPVDSDMDALAIHVISVLFASCRDQARATEDQHTALIQDNTLQSTNRLIVEWEN